MGAALRIAPEVSRALSSGVPVVALESTLIAHGLPRGRNLEVARERGREQHRLSGDEDGVPPACPRP